MAAEVLMFLVHLTTTAFMTAIIWFMQIGIIFPPSDYLSLILININS
jgi:hypothetical protein